MRSDVRSDWRALRDRAESVASNDEKQPAVVFSGEVHTVILSQSITAETVHIAGHSADDEKPPT